MFIAKRLRDAKRLEEVFTQAGINYLVETDTYVGGVIFRSERVGAFFYVEERSEEPARAVMGKEGFTPHQ